MTTCRFCAEEIQDAAIVCKHCGRDLHGNLPIVRTLPATSPVTKALAWFFGILIVVILAQACFGTP